LIPDLAVFDEWSGDPREILAILEDAQPLAVESLHPEELLISVQSDDPAWVIVPQLADPQWRAHWIDLDDQGAVDDEVILPAFCKGSRAGGWQRLAVPASGRWILRLEYDASDVVEGTAISAVAWLSWLLAAFSAVIQRWRGSFVPARV
jgi:hypothetical protein